MFRSISESPLDIEKTRVDCTFVLVRIGIRLLVDKMYACRHLRYIILDILFYDFKECSIAVDRYLPTHYTRE